MTQYSEGRSQEQMLLCKYGDVDVDVDVEEWLMQFLMSCVLS